MNPAVDKFMQRQDQWRAEFENLRAILLTTGLNEELKWGQPCYDLGGKNVVLMHGFKEYCAVLFHKGALLKDPLRVLIQQTKNVQAARQIRFKSLADVKKLEKTLKAYVKEAIENERKGLKVALKKIEEYEVPAEFAARLADSSRLQAAFEALTPGRRRNYLYHFGQPKKPETRIARIEKNLPRILDGLGLDD